MKYVVSDRQSGEIVASYERKADGWAFTEPNGPYLKHDVSAQAKSLIEAVLEQHREDGKVISIE